MAAFAGGGGPAEPVPTAATCSCLRPYTRSSGSADAHQPRPRRRVRGQVPGRAARGAARRSRAGRLRGPAGGARPGRRCRRVPARRRARARVHRRLLPTGRRRPPRLRCDRRHERAQRRLRHGRDPVAGPVGDRLPGGAPDRGARRRCLPEPTRRCERRGRSWPAGTRSATTSRSTGSPSSAPCTRTASGRRAARAPAMPSSSRSRSAPASCCRRSARGAHPRARSTAAVAAMRTLNREAAETLRPYAPHAVTDVTGFGLLGHAHETAARSGVRIELDAASLPGAARCARARERRCAHRWRPAQPRVRRARTSRAPRTTPSRRSPTTRRRRVAC